MKKYFGLILVVGLFVFAIEAQAWQQTHQKLEKYTPPTPPGPSAWCMKNPQACPAKNPRCHPVNNSLDACFDASGNGDGFVCYWETKIFKDQCNQIK